MRKLFLEVGLALATSRVRGPSPFRLRDDLLSNDITPICAAASFSLYTRKELLRNIIGNPPGYKVDP